MIALAIIGAVIAAFMAYATGSIAADSWDDDAAPTFALICGASITIAAAFTLYVGVSIFGS